MQTKTVTSEQAHQAWGEIIDAALSGQAVSITHHNRPAVVLVSAKQWADMRDQLVLYRAEMKRLRGVRDTQGITDREVDLWMDEIERLKDIIDVLEARLEGEETEEFDEDEFPTLAAVQA